MVKAVSRDIYNQKAVMKVESISKHHLESGSVREHVVFIVELQNAEDQKKELEIPNAITSNVLSANHICCAFPYHIVFDEQLHVKQCGAMIPKILKTVVHPNSLITSLFSIMHPPMNFKINNILLYMNSVFYLSMKQYGTNEEQLILRGWYQRKILV